MGPTSNSQAIADAVAALKRHGVVPAVASPLQQAAKTTARELQKRVIDEIAAFSDSANPEVLPELGQHLEALVLEVCRLLADAGPADLEFVRSYSRRRARQRFPLEALLHTYRCGHRVIAGWIRDAALLVADGGALISPLLLMP